MNLCRGLFAAVFVFSNSTVALAESPTYSVSGMALGGKVNFESTTYRQYNCNPSEQFDGFTWCQTKKEENERRGPFKAYYSILHSRDGTAVYINRFQEPAYWNHDEVAQDIRRFSQKLGEEPRVIKGPSGPGLPNTTIAIWGKVRLEPLDNESRNTLAADKNVTRGILVDTVGNYTRSAREGLPLYRLTGGPGFVWIASNKDGRGILRFLAIDPSAFYPAPQQFSPSPPPQQSSTPQGIYSNVGFWTIKHRVVDDLNGCYALSQFRDQTTFQMALVQSNPNNKEWLIFISNARWNAWISRKRTHTLRFISSKTWQGNLSVNDSNALWIGNLSIDFMNSIADASSLEIINDRNEILTSLDMTDSAAAIRAVANCLREHPYVVATAPKTTPAPKASPETETESVFSGTGFFVAPNRLVTNNHVVKDCRKLIEIRFADEPSRPATAYINAQDDTNDLALLHTELTPPSVASFGLPPRLGERVATYGFPYSDILSPDGNFTLGDVTARTGMKDDSRFFQVSVPIQPGNSGGPLLDMSGNVVGIITAQLSAYAMLPRKSIPQNVNFAIRSPIVINFLSAKGVSPKLASSDTSERRSLSQADVADLAKAFTVQIFCKGIASKASSTSADETDFVAGQH